MSTEQKFYQNMIRTSSFVLFILWGICHSLTGQPMSIVSLQLTHRISDNDAEEFYFRSPTSPYFLSNGDFVVGDQSQVLYFSKDGVFLRNLYKRGEGPFEMTDYIGACQTDEGISIVNKHPAKIIFFNSQGEPKRSLRIPFDKTFYFLSCQNCPNKI